MNTEHKLTPETYHRRYGLPVKSMRQAIEKELIAGSDAFDAHAKMTQVANGMALRRDPQTGGAIEAVGYLRRLLDLLQEEIVYRYGLSDEDYRPLSDDGYLPKLVNLRNLRDADEVKVEEESNLTHREFFDLYGGGSSNIGRMLNKAIRAETFDGNAILDSLGATTLMAKKYRERGIDELAELASNAGRIIKGIADSLAKQIMRIYNLEER